MTANRHERCDSQIESGRTITLVPEPNEEQLNDKQLVDYREHRTKFIQWLLEEGKNPEKREGDSPYSVYGTGYRTARFDRWVWSHEDRYTIPPSPQHGDGWRVASLVLTSLDAGLRPIEVSRARPNWVDVDNVLLRTPREDSSKNKDN